MADVLAIAGSPAHPSRTYGILEYATQLISEQGLETTIISVRDLPAEDLVYGRYNSPALEKPKDLIQQASGIIIATPIYKAAYTGVLKSFLDLLPQKALTGKILLPFATGGTIAHLLAVEYALKPVLSELGARHILSTVYAVDKQIQFSQEGSIQLEEELSQRLHENVAELVRVVKLAKVNEQKLSVP
ncbi:NADPH-dependent FMN reductase [Cylindrospermopsis raciborskii CS-506_D]|uniref:NADPH-dependent FMN reductase n=2 Tax=Cylindrospermopsis raciborskii TaxID=77022 RepID=A0A838WKU9_9CYAN|nr:NADPH-dependent FMN reductase [Cylindrospermopsis raciborskii]MBA4446072.1 NADPH-dependent FMN reductase [Cylindrospermopsis raciborskii CS-506_C]MBA4450302.1 NADPH-dependent FMN reductase [Cylindrospermopsis raciborskii CS-506_D]MBA4456928.1 NADPH-dependent FMN reductase [Cylindrospermopsis raciborskii CS-506_B]MBA4466281.1 NADPH-dependent FMN reductase [Cylindrospermopsis raciborskii CS-506_A]OHY41649.1 FMN reductase (NADPH) [Cylindrospermopsis raciborskii CS-508]